MISLRVAPFVIGILLLTSAGIIAFVPEGESQASGPRLVLEISDATSKPTKPFEAFDTVQFTAFDFDGDGRKEILAKNDNNWIYVFDSKTGAILAEMRDTVPPDWKWRELSGAAIGDVNGNGRWDIVSTSSAGHLTAWELDPTKSDSTKFHFEKLWSREVKPELVEPEFRKTRPWTQGQSTGFDGAPYLADVDGDGADEIFVQSDNIAGQWGFKGNGDLMWGRVYDDGNANPWVADLDRDGKLEVVFATDAGRLWVYDAKTGSYRWQFDARDHGATPGSISLAPGLIDINGDGKLEVIFGTRMAVEDKDDPEWFHKMHTMIFAVSSKGELLWNRTYDWGEPHMYMFPAAYDVDGDGVDDAVMMDWNTIGHKPGDWETTGPPNLFAVNGKGDVLFQTKVSTYWSNKNVIIADIDADGVQDIIVNKGGVKDGIAFYDLKGKQKGLMEIPWHATRAPFVTDLHGDGRMDLLVPIDTKRNEPNYRTLDVGYRAGKILVYDMGVPLDAAWDNHFVFNHKLDHLYGGKAKSAARPVVDVKMEPVETATGFAVRIKSDSKVQAVSAAPVGSGAAPTKMTLDGDVWRADVKGERFEVTAHLSDGAFITRHVDAKRPADQSPTPTTPTPPTGGGDPEPLDPTPGSPTPPVESKEQDSRSLDIPGAHLGGVLAAVGAAAVIAARRRR